MGERLIVPSLRRAGAWPPQLLVLSHADGVACLTLAGGLARALVSRIDTTGARWTSHPAATAAGEREGWTVLPGQYASLDGLGATLDRIIAAPGPNDEGVAGPGVLELKNVDWIAHRAQWGTEPPAHILVQLQAQLAATGFGWGAVAALVGGNDLHIYRYTARPRLQADIGRKNFLMLRNHGLLTVGKTIPDAFLSMYTFENTCRIQIDAQAGGGELTLIDPRILQGLAEVMKTVTAGQGANIAWPALLRKLDRTDPSYKT